MTYPTNAQLKAQTLRWCNARRKEDGRKPLNKLPKGKTGDPDSCPCGLATGLVVQHTHAHRVTQGKRTTYRLPRSVAQFVFRFDAGEIPELIQR